MNTIRKSRVLEMGFLLMTLIFWASCASKGSLSEGDSSNSQVIISKLALVSNGTGSELNIVSNREPKYNVFKLMDPERVVIDIIDARLSEDAPSSLGGNDLIKEVKVQALEDSLSALVRMEVVLNSSANYLAELTSDGMTLRLLRVGEGEAELPQVTPEASPVPMAEVSPSPQPVEPSPSAEANAAPLPLPEPIPEPVKELAAVPTPMPSIAPEIVPLPIPVPEMATELKPESSTPVEATAKTEMAKPAEESVAPKSAETSSIDALAKEESAELPIPLPIVEGKEKSKAKSGKKKEFETNSLKPVADQEIPGLMTEGTSLLTELDTKVYTGRRVSLEFQDADVQDILKLIADVSKLNIVTGDDVKGKLSLKLVDVPWDQALDIILTTLGLDKTQHGNIIRVAPSEKLRKEREVALANDKAAKQLEPLKLKLINVNYAKADDLSSRIKNLLSDRGTVDTDGRTNTLIVKDIREHLSRVENLVKALDTQTPQVRIEARIVQADDQFTKDLGIQWGPTLHLDSTNSKQRAWQFPNSITAGGADASMTFPGYAVDALPGNATAGTLGFRLGSINSIFNLDLKLQYLEQESMGRVVSRPSISVLDNKTASIIQGSKVPFLAAGTNGTTVSFQEVGIQINVTPQITSDGAVILKVHTSSNEILNSSVGGNPITTIREATTEMLVKSARTAVLGGVFKTSDTSSKAGVPGLYNLPVLGWLFGNSSSKTKREETLVFITPYILNDARVATSAPGSESLIEH